MMRPYAKAGVLVSTDWVAEHKSDPDVVLVQVDVELQAFDEGHIDVAVGWNWRTQLCDRVTRDIASPKGFQTLLRASGITPDTTVVLYGDHNNWFACWAYWQLKIYAHEKVAIMNGGRKKWVLERRPVQKGGTMGLGIAHARGTPADAGAAYVVPEPDESIRAFLDDVRTHVANGGTLIDVRTPAEYEGRVLAPEGSIEGALRGGHIPGALLVPWYANCNDDGTFKSADELFALYGKLGVDAEQDVIAYCRIGERSSMTWFVLHELLGYTRVRNYDGSWIEWGNIIRSPVAIGPDPG